MKLRSIAALFLLLSGGSIALGGVVVHVDLDPGDMGMDIMTSRAYAVGETVNVDFVLEVTEDTLLSTYVFSVFYDSTELSYVSRAETPGNIPGGWSEINPGSQGSDTNLLYLFDALGNTALSAAQGRFVVASATFTAIAPAGDMTDVDLQVGLYNTAVDGFLNQAFDPIPAGQLMFPGASITAVPEPSVLTLCLLSSLGCCAIRRRKLECLSGD